MKPRFYPIEFSESLDPLNHNPARGWYRMVTIDLSQAWEAPDLHADSTSLVLLRVMLGAYRQQPIPQSALTILNDALNWFRGQRRSLILRCVYDLDGKGMEHDPLSLSLLMQHIGQLGAVIAGYTDVVWLYQGLLIGSWGEMHNSRYVTPDHMRSLHRALSQVLPDSIYLAVRKPAQWRMLYPMGTTSDPRTGLFNDALFGSDTELGTFGYTSRSVSGWQDQWLPEEELTFEAGVSELVPFGGEVIDGLAAGCSAQEMLERLRARHVTYLNQEWDPKVLNSWRLKDCGQTGTWTGISFYDYLAAHLGYRFVVSNVRRTSGLLALGGSIACTITNTGTARLYLHSRLRIKQTCSDGIEEWTELPDTLEDLGPGESRQIQVRLKQTAGKVWMEHIVTETNVPIAFGNAHADDGGAVLLGEFK